MRLFLPRVSILGNMQQVFAFIFTTTRNIGSRIVLASQRISLFSITQARCWIHLNRPTSRCYLLVENQTQSQDNDRASYASLEIHPSFYSAYPAWFFNTFVLSSILQQQYTASAMQSSLFHGDRLGQVSWLVHIQPSQGCNMVG